MLASGLNILRTLHNSIAKFTFLIGFMTNCVIIDFRFDLAYSKYREVRTFSEFAIQAFCMRLCAKYIAYSKYGKKLRKTLRSTH